MTNTDTKRKPQTFDLSDELREAKKKAARPAPTRRWNLEYPESGDRVYVNCRCGKRLVWMQEGQHKVLMKGELLDPEPGNLELRLQCRQCSNRVDLFQNDVQSAVTNERASALVSKFFAWLPTHMEQSV